MAEDFFRVRKGLSVANNTANLQITPNQINIGTVASLNGQSLSIGANLVVNNDLILLGNSTVNAVVNSTALKYQNSTVEFTLTLPTAAEIANNGVLFSNGSWTRVASRATVDNTFSSPESGDQWYNTETGAWLLYIDDGDTEQWVRVNGSPGTSDYQSLSGFSEPLNAGIAVSASANTLTLSLRGSNGNQPNTTNVVRIPFRSSTQSSGGVTWRSVSSNVELTLSEGSTLGFTNATAGRIWITLFDDGGTVKLGAFNASSSNSTVTRIHSLSEWGLASATAEGGAGGADSTGVHYANSTITSKAYRILGFVEWANTGLTEAGKWNTTNLLRTSLHGPGCHKPGDVVQRVLVTDGEAASGTTTTPLDDTIPQITEGTQFMSLAITPSSAANILRVNAELELYSNTGAVVITALFKDSVANAVAVTKFWASGIAHEDRGILCHLVRANSLAATTYKVRSGGHTTSQISFNARAGVRSMGGALNSVMKISEIMG